MDLGLKNKVVLVTGGSRGIGRGIAAAFAAEGSRIVICARGQKDIDDAVTELRNMKADVLGLTVDVTRKEQIDSLVKTMIGTYGTIDVLINNAGGNKRNLFTDTTTDDWQQIIDLNLKSHVEVSRAFLPYMIKQKSGSIIFISSIYGRELGGPTLSIYNSTKSALISLSKVMAVELAPKGIRVNSIAPGSIRFPGGSWDRRYHEDPQGIKEFVKQELPLGRFGTVEEVANVVCFIASDRASLVTGTCLNIDGCQSRSLI